MGAPVDANGDRTTFGFDALNRQVTEKDPDGSVTTTAFDAQGNQVLVTDADGNPTTMVYDVLNRLTETISLQSGTTTYAYDLGSRLTSTTDALGQRRDIQYDALNRETGETWTVGGSVVNTLTYTFDAANNLFSAGDANGTYTFTLDALNRQTAQQGPFGTTLTMSYDAASNQVQVLDNFGGTTSSSYDALNRLTSRGLTTTGGVALHEALTWTAQNLLATVSRYDDEGTSTLVGTSSYGYDTASRLTQIWHASGTGTVLASYVYSFDAGSRLTQQVVDGTSTTFSYDQASQLTQAGSATYGYDPTGNRTNTGYATGAGNQMTNDGTWTYTYDAKGQLIEKSMGPSAETWYYGYNLRGQMTLAENEATPGGTLISLSSYAYDVFGNRIEEDVWTATAGTTTVSRQAYLGSNAWADLDASDALVVRHLFLDGANQVFAAVTASGTVTWDLADRLGSVTDVVNFAGTTDLDRITYDAYGNFTETNAAAGDVYKWEGGRYDVPTGLTLFGMRYYDAAAGVWTTPDPSGFAGGQANFYQYVGNNPTNGTDPTGLYLAPWDPNCVWQWEGSWLGDLCASPKFQGGAQIAGGLGEMGAGIALLFAPEPTMLTKASAWFLMVHACDTIGAGINTLRWQSRQDTLTVNSIAWSLQQGGYDQNTAYANARTTEALAVLAAGGYGAYRYGTQPRPVYYGPPSRSGVTLADSVAAQVVRPDGNNFKILQAIEQQWAISRPTTAQSALLLVARATQSLEFRAGTMSTLPNGDILLKNDQGVWTTINANGEILITRGREVLLHLIQ